MPARDLTDHTAHLRPVERRERKDAVVRAHRPGRRNSGRVVATTNKGDCAPRSASRAMRSSEVGSAQWRSSKASTTGCERAPAKPRSIAASCRRRIPRAEFGPANLPQRMSTSGQQGRASAASGGSASKCSLGRRDALVGRVGAAKASLPHSASGCRGVF